MPDLLDTSALLGNLPNLLPGSATTLATSQDGLAALLHTAMTALSFRLVATDEAAPAKEPETAIPGLLPEDWNRKGPDVYTFKYKHDQSSFTFLLKLVKLSGRVIVHGIAIEDDKTKSFEINIADYLSTSFFPHDVKSTDRPLVHGYISSARVTDLIALFKNSIIQPLIPGLQKEGYQESATTSTSGTTSAPTSGARAPPLRNPSPPPPLDRPFAHPYASGIPSSNPLQIGRSDLDPLGGRGNPFAPPPLFGGPGFGGDGMFVGPDHPMFNDPLRRGGRGGSGMGGMGGMGPWGGDGYLPPMGAPPGARFDPIGPGPLSGHGPGRRPPHTSGNPDNDEFMPPGGGHDDMYM